jgi:tetratricopeptide (TPR) repeat protein
MRKPRLQTFLVCLVTVAILAPAALQAQAYGRVSLWVKDAEGNPIEGAKVTAVCEELPKFLQEVVTKRKGQAALAFVDATKVYTVTIEKEGYTKVEIPIKAELRTTTEQEVVLQVRGEEVAPSGDAPRRFTAAEKTYNTGVEMLQAGDLEGAKAQFNEALAKDPDLSAAHAALAAIYLEQKNYDQAISEANAFLAENPDHPTAYQTLYEAYRRKGDTAKAQEALAKMSALEGGGGDSAVLLYNEGVEALRAENLSTAQARFEAALAADPELAPAFLGLAKIHLSRGEFAEAAARADQLLALEPNDYAGLLASYEANSELGNQEKVDAAFAQLSANHPEQVGQLFYDKGIELFNAGNARAAVTQLERALEAQPELVKAHYHLGLACINTGETAKAKQHLQQFLDMAPDDPDAGSASEMLSFLGN